MPCLKIFVIGALAGLSAAVTGFAQPQIQILGAITDSDSIRPRGISANGQVVTGVIDYPGAFDNVPFIWSDAGSLEPVALPPDAAFGECDAVSSTGRAVGFIRPVASSITKAAVWDSDGSFINLGSLGSTSTAGSRAFSISSDGTVVVGRTSIDVSGVRAFRWSADSGMVSIGTLGGIASEATAVSSNGDWIAGASSEAGPGPRRAFRWSSGTGMTSLGTMAGVPGEADYYAAAISPGGECVAGYTAWGFERTAFIWNAAAGFTDIGKPLGEISAPTIRSMSDDGSIIVGANQGSTSAVVWTSEAGMEYLFDRLQKEGVDMTGWTSLDSAWSISSDGRRITGYGRYEGQEVAFLITDFAITPPCPPDVTGDNTINLADLNAVLGAFGTDCP